MSNVQMTKRRENVTADKSNMNLPLIPRRAFTLPGKHKLVNMRVGLGGGGLGFQMTA